jgi:hypothetical protein
MLAGVGLGRLGLPHGDRPQRIHAEVAAPVDDLLVWTSRGGRLFVNVKRTVQLSAKQKSPLWSAGDQFVRLFSEAPKPATPGQEWRGALDPATDRLVLAFDRNTSNRAAIASGALQKLAERPPGVPRSSCALSEPEAALIAALEQVLSERWADLTGVGPTEEELDRLIRLIRFLPLDLEGEGRDAALSLLRADLLDGQDAPAAWAALKLTCTDLAVDRASADAGYLRTQLSKQGIGLRSGQSYLADIERLLEVTKRTLCDLRRFSFLPTRKVESREEGPSLPRACIGAMAQAASSTSFVVTGDPGSGKSGALVCAAEMLQAEGHPVVVLSVDRYGATSLPALDQELGLVHSLPEVLRNWSSTRPGVILIDALDAGRGGGVERAFKDLIRAVRREAQGWNVVASCRTFDLRFGAELRDLFRGTPVRQDFSSPDFGAVAHLHIPPLCQNELAPLEELAPHLWSAYCHAPASLRAALASPYNMFLLAEILSTEGPVTDTSGLTSDIQLLDRYVSVSRTRP